MKRLIIFIFLCLLLSGCATENKGEVAGALLTYDEIQEEISIAERDLENLQSELESFSEEYEVALNAIEREDEIFTNVRKKEEELIELENSISEAEKQLKILSGELVAFSDEPIKIGAGYFYFGQDIDPGRYQVKPQEGKSGNFFVRGNNRVNIILGENRDSHVESFVFEAKEGDELEATIPIFLYPVE